MEQNSDERSRDCIAQQLSPCASDVTAPGHGYAAETRVLEEQQWRQPLDECEAPLEPDA
jgi:hypothetical protein